MDGAIEPAVGSPLFLHFHIKHRAHTQIQQAKTQLLTGYAHETFRSGMNERAANQPSANTTFMCIQIMIWKCISI